MPKHKAKQSDKTLAKSFSVPIKELRAIDKAGGLYRGRSPFGLDPFAEESDAEEKSQGK